MSTSTKPNHIGHKISRIRELRGLKQEALAFELKVSQQTVSKIEQSETVEEQILEQIAQILGVPVEGIKNFSEEAVFNIIGNSFSDNSSNNNNYLCTINPLEKIIQLYDEKVALLERLLQSEREKIELLKGKN
ncbi:helix-turn-helix domain-containing protein [Dyadobacter frigoris]|uniref:Helix-turn-helix transcriptional regulator n=1 Tax=Dyadobacter frigoris TaxID=2576211 RepID=A0A4U6CXY4_9BACT|nr:helix-turn-helix transcriptional regulator [Dyadobacter frigoris]TKT88607.1 helix-turn-helix transcriptional regulator [Dyadobacter frigoris]GLU54940.1 transcriptional regulator [Dyadobacter frigoris]